jgi:FKBP-type peptidyl-prolyl cis-trans isomerase
MATPVDAPPLVLTSDGKVTKIILQPGTGPQPKRGQKVDCHYVGTLLNGTEFDSSRDRGKPFTFTLGQGVIAGWSVGVSTMKVGEISRLSIGSDYAYGSKGASGIIPANATLNFEIELLKIY